MNEISHTRGERDKEGERTERTEREERAELDAESEGKRALVRSIFSQINNI